MSSTCTSTSHNVQADVNPSFAAHVGEVCSIGFQAVYDYGFNLFCDCDFDGFCANGFDGFCGSGFLCRAHANRTTVVSMTVYSGDT